MSRPERRKAVIAKREGRRGDMQWVIIGGGSGGIMGLRFRRSIRLLPGVRWNFGLKSTSISIGGRGFHYTVGTKGARIGAGLPGTGLSWSQTAPTPSQMMGRVPATSLRKIWLPLIVFVSAIYLAYATCRPSPSSIKASAVQQPTAQMSSTRSGQNSVPQSTASTLNKRSNMGP